MSVFLDEDLEAFARAEARLRAPDAWREVWVAIDASAAERSASLQRLEPRAEAAACAGRAVQ